MCDWVNFHGDLSRHLIRNYLYQLVDLLLIFVEIAEMLSMGDPQIDEN